MERPKFYETLYKKALECASSGDIIQQNTTNSTPKSSNQIEYQLSNTKLFFYPLFKKDSSD